MVRKFALIVAAAAVAGAAALVGIPTGAAQETETTDAEVEAAAQAVSEAPIFELGQRYVGESWDLEVQNVFIDDARDRAAWSEVRLSVAVRNNTDGPLPYSDGAFFDGAGYPRFVLVDANDVERKYRMLRPSQDAVPGSNITEIAAGLTGRWTVGFEVPTVNRDSLRLDARVAGMTVASWSLDTTSEPAGWEPPALDTVAVGDTIDWIGDDLLARPVSHGSLVCGDPENQFVTQVFALQVDVTNAGFTDDIAFPGIRKPATAAVAQWSDGATARLSYETFGGDREVLYKPSDDWVFIPPTDGEFFSRGFLFGVTRDSRLGSVDDPPQGVLLNLPDGSREWLELDAEGDLPINPAFCDRGLFDGPLPLAFTPAQAFEVGGKLEPEPTVEELNMTTQQLITQAAIVTFQAAVNEDKTFDELTERDFANAWPNVAFAPGLINANTGLVGFEALDEFRMILMTVSPTNDYYCAGVSVGEITKIGFGVDFDSTLNACLPPDLTEEEQAADAEASDQGTGDGSGTGDTGGTP